RLPYPRDGAHFKRALAVAARFTVALCDAAPAEGREELPFVLHGPAAQSLSHAALHFDPARRTLEHAGELLVSELAPSAWEAQVGHHTLVRSALRGPAAKTTGELADALLRATLWV